MNTEQLRTELQLVNRQGSVVRVEPLIDDHVMVTDAKPLSKAMMDRCTHVHLSGYAAEYIRQESEEHRQAAERNSL